MALGSLGGVRAAIKCLVSPYPRLLPQHIQIAGIAGKALREKVDKPAPFPYKEKRYTIMRSWFDRTTHRMDENSKLVVVEGPLAAGKTAFAKSLAEDLEMLYMPMADMDDYYINEYGYDLRKMDPELPSTCRSFDVRNFWKDPHHVDVGAFQIRMYMVKYLQYINALAHIFNTGQGVVLDRCAYSDFVFVEAMYHSKFISRNVHDAYYQIRENTLSFLLKPHLVIYLDVPAATCLQRIKARNQEEAASKVYTPQFLENMEEVYKQRYLKDISTHAELLVYDWSSGGDVEVVVEDIERLDMDNYEKTSTKMKNWRFHKEWNWAEKRALFTNEKMWLMQNFFVPLFNVPELFVDGEDARLRHAVIDNAPGMKYSKGYNEDMGDSGLLFKNTNTMPLPSKY